MIRKWLQFIFGCYLIWIFIFQVVPFILRIPMYQKIHQTVQENDIDASVLFYTESEVADQADFYRKRVMED